MTARTLFLTAVLLTACAVAGCGDDRPREKKLAEASASFDMADVGPFLTRLADIISGGFDRELASRLTKWIGRQAVDSEREYLYAVVFGGTKTDLRVVAVIDDVDAVDLYLHTHPELARRIDLLMDEFFQDVGK